jgi:hypothetical protein
MGFGLRDDSKRNSAMEQSIQMLDTLRILGATTRNEINIVTKAVEGSESVSTPEGWALSQRQGRVEKECGGVEVFETTDKMYVCVLLSLRSERHTYKTRGETSLEGRGSTSCYPAGSTSPSALLSRDDLDLGGMLLSSWHCDFNVYILRI